MLAQRLCKAQSEIQLHRRWLNSFVTQHRDSDRPSLEPSSQVSPPQRDNFPLRRFAQAPGTVFRYGSLTSRNAVEIGHLQRQYAVTRAYASLATKKPRNRHLRRSNPDEATIEGLRLAVPNLDLGDVSKLYTSLIDKASLKQNDVRAIAQCLHYSFRTVKHSGDAASRRQTTDRLVAFAEVLVADLMKGDLAPHCQAHVHLLGFFKESGMRDAGVRFWQWLETQDELYVNEDVYGAAIELLAVNGAPLSRMEDLYRQALERFPGNFSAYHLSPEAMLPDRTQQTTLKGIPMSLLQGILTARLLRGDAKNAYLALDTALRLYPDQVPPRYFQLFLEERPLLEAYTVFAIACRVGTKISSNQFRGLVSAIRTSSDLSTAIGHAFAVRAILSSFYLYLNVGGELSQNVLSELVIAITQFLRIRGVANLDRKQKQKIVDEVMAIIRASFAVFARFGAKPGLTAFNSIIVNLGGFGGSKKVIDIALADAQSLGLKPNEVTRRSVLTAAGTLGDGDFVVKAWQDLVEGRTAAGAYPDATDFHVFLKNAIATSQVDFAKEEFERLKEKLPESAHYRISLALSEENSKNQSADTVSLDPAALLQETQKVLLDLRTMDEKTQNRLGVQDLRDMDLPMTLMPIESLLSDAETRVLYDELTTEHPAAESTNVDNSELSTTPSYSSEASRTGSDGAVSPTNLPFETLRFENWKSINYLLEQAEFNDKAYHKLVDDALAAGKLPPQRTLGLSLGSAEQVESYGLSDVVPLCAGSDVGSAKRVEDGRREILRLRGRLPE